MKKSLLLIFMMSATIFASSCNNDLKPECVGRNSDSTSEFRENLAAKEQFAQILSKAVYENEGLRKFLQKEALNQFDNDYDIFYPLLKNTPVGNGGTFRDILSKYDEQGMLSSIEASAPLLTILVPDWSWINENCFSAENWDTSDPEVAVGYEDYLDSHVIYVNGEKAAEIGADEFPAFPVLVIKNNERLRMKAPETKGMPATYEFVDEAFDGSGNYKTKETYTQTWDYNKDGSSDFVSEDMLNSLVIGAWNEFGSGWGDAMHRDYIYYGMSKTNADNGKLNPYIREKILRFKINPSAAHTISDYQDPIFQNEVIRWRVENNLHGNEIQQYLWSEGAFDIRMTFYWGDKKENAVKSVTKIFNIRPQEIWELTSSSVKKTLRPFDGFKYRYVFTNSKDNLVAKWYYPEDTDLDEWDLVSRSSNFWFDVKEFDEEMAITQTIKKKYKFSTSIQSGDSSIEVEDIKINYGLSSGTTEEEETEMTKTMSWTHKSNELGECEYSFARSIIKSNRYLKDGKYGYDLTSVSTGTVTVTFLPHDIRSN